MITKRLARFALGPSFLESLEDGASGKEELQAMWENRDKMERIMRAEEQVLSFVGLGSTSRRRGMRRSQSQGSFDDFLDVELEADDDDDDEEDLSRYPHCPHCDQHHPVDGDDDYCEQDGIMGLDNEEYGAFLLTSAAHVANFVVQWPFSIMSMRLAAIKGHSTSYLDSFASTFLHKPVSLANFFAGMPASIAYESISFGVDAMAMVWYDAYQEMREQDARNRIELMVHSFTRSMMENGVTDFDPEEFNHLMELEEERNQQSLEDIRSKLKRGDERKFRFAVGLLNQVVLFPFTRLQYLQCLGLLPAAQFLPTLADYADMFSVGYWKINWAIFLATSLMRYIKTLFQELAMSSFGITSNRQQSAEVTMVTTYLGEMMSTTRAELNLFPLMPFVYRIIAHHFQPASESLELCTYLDMSNWQGLLKSFIVETLASWSVSQVYHGVMVWYTGAK